MEIGLETNMPTYSGGLGVLAGDTIRSAADMKIPMVGVTLVHRYGYFHQKLDGNGWQTEEPEKWDIQSFLQKRPEQVTVTIEQRQVYIAAWQYDVKGVTGYTVPVYFLDTDLPENAPWDRTLTDHLYGGDEHYRLCQEVVLGIGGVRMLRALGHKALERYHMNEGHAAFLSLELLDEHAANAGNGPISQDDIQAVREKCVFTTHTPVPAGHDQFSMDMVTRVLGQHEVLEMEDLYAFGGRLNMTYLALNLSHYVNGVAKKHGEVSQIMFANYKIDWITNGIHSATWCSEPFQALFDSHIPGWREDNFNLRYALNIPKQQIWEAHTKAKQKLIDFVNSTTDTQMDPNVLTLGFARRAAVYKRVDLLLQDIARLKNIASQVGRFQLIYSGKAHPQDQGGKELIQGVFQFREQLKNDIKIAYLPDYNMKLGKLITSGVDVWLNTPEPPMEASGTSGMKAALNGVPSLSILDGWWIEGCIENVTGWAIGEKPLFAEQKDDRSKDAESLYEKLEQSVLPTFYRDKDRFINIMLHAIALNGSFFNTQRMMQQYVLKAYFE